MNDVLEAWLDIGRAEERYRTLLRAALDDGVQQTEIADALKRTREMLRRDLMTDEQRAELRRADAERKKAIRAAAKAATGGAANADK